VSHQKKNISENSFVRRILGFEHWITDPDPAPDSGPTLSSVAFKIKIKVYLLTYFFDTNPGGLKTYGTDPDHDSLKQCF
jgi:hypothetical protein